MVKVFKTRIEIVGAIDENGELFEEDHVVFDLPVKNSFEYEDLKENLLIYLLMGKRILR